MWVYQQYKDGNYNDLRQHNFNRDYNNNNDDGHVMIMMHSIYVHDDNFLDDITMRCILNPSFKTFIMLCWRLPSLHLL